MTKQIVFGTGNENNQKKFNEKNFLKIIDFCIDRKILTFDTSDNYFNGNIEKLLGSRIKNNRKIKIINKFRIINDINILKKNLDNSLKRLNKDYIDIYMPHWPIYNFNKDILAEFAYEAIERKKIREFGLSNFSLKMIKDFKLHYKNKISLQFELNLSNFYFNKNLIDYCKKKKINTYCYSINKNFPDNTKINLIKRKYNINNYEFSLTWISNLNFVSPIIRSNNQFNIMRNIDLFNKKINIKTNFLIKKNLYKKIDFKLIKKINSESGYVYKNLSDAKKNKFKLYPSPIDISYEIKKYGLLKPFYLKKIKKSFFCLLSAQARYWAYRIAFPKAKSIKGILIN